MGRTTDKSVLNFWHRRQIFVFHRASKPNLRPTQTSLQIVQALLLLLLLLLLLTYLFTFLVTASEFSLGGSSPNLPIMIVPNQVAWFQKSIPYRFSSFKTTVAGR
jgi:hypothetical protein